jgi:hypothetical protein
MANRPVAQIRFNRIEAKMILSSEPHAKFGFPPVREQVIQEM